MNAVKTSYGIIAERKDLSRDAAHATTILAVMLAKVTGHKPNSHTDDVQIAPLQAVNKMEGYVQVPEDYQLDIEPFNNVLHDTDNFDWVSARFLYQSARFQDAKAVTGFY